MHAACAQLVLQSVAALKQQPAHSFSGFTSPIAHSGTTVVQKTVVQSEACLAEVESATAVGGAVEVATVVSGVGSGLAIGVGSEVGSGVGNVGAGVGSSLGSGVGSLLGSGVGIFDG